MLGPNGETFGSPAPTKRGKALKVPLLANSIPYERGVPLLSLGERIHLHWRLRGWVVAGVKPHDIPRCPHAVRLRWPFRGSLQGTLGSLYVPVMWFCGW